MLGEEKCLKPEPEHGYLQSLTRKEWICKGNMEGESNKVEEWGTLKPDKKCHRENTIKRCLKLCDMFKMMRSKNLLLN